MSAGRRVGPDRERAAGPGQLELIDRRDFLCRTARSSAGAQGRARRSSTESASALGGFMAASVSRKRLALGSSGMREAAEQGARAASAYHKASARRVEAGQRVRSSPMVGEERDHESIHAEGDTARVGRLIAAVLQSPHLAKVLAVIVEAHAGGGLCLLVVRDQQLELERLLDLAHRHDLADAAEERVVRDLDGIRQREFLRELLVPGPSSPRGTPRSPRVGRCARTRACGRTAADRASARARAGSSRPPHRISGHRAAMRPRAAMSG